MPLQATSGAASYDAFGGGVPSEPNYIESVFQTYLYTGNGSTQTINNGIDLAGKGGLTWIKVRDYADSHRLFDTSRGVGKYLVTNGTFAETTNAASVTAFNSNGFSLGDFAGTNGTAFGSQYASWTFRKQPKFFDVVTYTGNGNAGRAISHALASTPGFIAVKQTSASGQNWKVWHRAVNGGDAFGVLNTTSAFDTTQAKYIWGNNSAYIAPTSTDFTVSNDDGVNANGATYVAYLFAHNAGGFGLTGTDNVISCGSYVGSGSSGTTVNLGWEPQWVMIKKADDPAGNGPSGWIIMDNMRGLGKSYDNALTANTSISEAGDVSVSNAFELQSTGFKLLNANGALNVSTDTYIYIAIRRGPMKVPTSGTSVFSPVARTGTGTATNISGIGFAPDFVLVGGRDGLPYNATSYDRLRGSGYRLKTAATSAEGYDSDTLTAFGSNSLSLGVDNFGYINTSGGVNYINWIFKRAPSTFDEVCFTPTGVAQTITHNLGVAPELIIGKTRDAAFNWYVYAAPLGNTQALYLNTTDTPVSGQYLWNNTSPTASVFSVGTGGINTSAATKSVAYLWATNAGVTKVGSYIGNGSSQTINCGFTSGSRMVLIIRTDASGDRYIWDSARGIVSGNDPHLSLNSTAAEVTTDDTIDTDSTGFIVNQVSATNCNVNGASYIFLSYA